MVVQTVGQESALTESLRTPRVNLLREEMYDDENELLVSAGCQQKNGSDILRTEWTYLVPLTGSPPSRVPHWARSMQWRRRRKRSSTVCWSSWLRAVNCCEYSECCFRCCCCRTKCVGWYSTLTGPVADSRYIAISTRDLVIHQAVTINKTPRQGSASIVPRALRKLVVS